MGEHRPAPSGALTGAELRRWYWTKAELLDLARELGLPTRGGKLELTERLVAALDGAPLPSPAPSRRAASPGLSGSLTPETVVPPGQRCTQALRAFFVEQLGPGFRFDGPMRAWVAGAAGRPLAEGVEHWHRTRHRPPGDIGEQFELNGFVRAWHAAHPDGTRQQALVAWRRHRSLPVEQR